MAGELKTASVGRLLQLLARAACYHSSALRDCFKKQNKQSGKSPPLAVPHKGVCTDADAQTRTHACVCRRSSSEPPTVSNVYVAWLQMHTVATTTRSNWRSWLAAKLFVRLNCPDRAFWLDKRSMSVGLGLQACVCASVYDCITPFSYIYIMCRRIRCHKYIYKKRKVLCTSFHCRIFMYCLLTNINTSLSTHSGNVAVISASQQEVSPWKHAFFLFFNGSFMCL